MKEGATIPDPIRQSELARDAFQRVVTEMSRLAEMARKAHSVGLAGITARMRDNVDEFRKIAQPH